ncbi:hypothetical protein SeF3a_225 [Salmonella phage SeF3a]|nr:hypothetical protein SeF3a_225 [Salmonella phage SeF3a]
MCWCRLANRVLSDSELITLQQGVSFSDGQVRPLTPARWILTYGAGVLVLGLCLASAFTPLVARPFTP